MVKKSSDLTDSPGIGRLTVILNGLLILHRKDIYFEIELDGDKKSSNLEKTSDEIKEVYIWSRRVPLHDDSVLIIKAMSKDKLGKKKLVGEVVYGLKTLITSLIQDVKIPLQDPSGKGSENHVLMRLEYIAPTLDPDEQDFHIPTPEQKLEKKSKDKKEQLKTIFDRSKLSTKKQDFQIRTNVHEGRNLVGGNLHPVCNVTIGKQSKHTRVQRSTTKPLWDESLLYEFNISPMDLCDLPISIEILNSRKIRSDCLIGSFKFDLSLVYENEEHAFWHKWVLLTDPEDKESGAKGYVKISISILGPGDKIKLPPKVTHADEQIDIESNLLRPAGIQLQPSTFTIRVYQAEDIPEMDHNYFDNMKRKLGMNQERLDKVDPYVIVGFAGKKLRTKYINHCYSPEWNQELNIGVQLPTMCEQLMLKIMDKDHLNKDDVVATHFIQLTRLSSADTDDEGFLPTFGPAYVNFYGSPREFGSYSMELGGLDKGLGEGCSYRGRVLLELTVKTGKYPTREEHVQDISNDDLFAVQQFLRRRKYRTFVGFLEASMINPVDGPIEFEVSIGEYGNKFLVHTGAAAAPSSTQPQNAIFDGQYYYYLPWSSSSPCIMLISHWEDCQYRIESLNFIDRIISTLENNLADLKYLMRAEAPIEECARKYIELLDKLIEDLQTPLKELPMKGYTHLDQKMFNLRDDDMRKIMDEAIELKENANELDHAVTEIEIYMTRLRDIAVEPQNSIPDLIIWMLVGGKREAYCRIPSNQIMYSLHENATGKYCGKITTFFLKKPTRQEKIHNKKNWILPAKLELFLWMGLEDLATTIQHRPYTGEIAVYAETYENQVYIPPVPGMGSWTTKPMTRPKWSDITGHLKLTKDSFKTPTGWLWHDDWFIQKLENSFDIDSALTTFQTDVFENLTRIPGGTWDTAEITWTDVMGEINESKDNIFCPIGWEWSDHWTVDLSRAVDEEGFEYCLDTSSRGFVPVEKTYHLCKRRRWIRTRKRNPDIKQQENKKRFMKAAEEGWEYARLFRSKFHPEQRTIDLVRRRLWLRKMVTVNPECEPIFTFDQQITKKGAGTYEHSVKSVSAETLGDIEEYKEELIPKTYAPRMYVTYKAVNTFHLRAYIYQARDLFSADASGLSDPYTRVIFGHQSLSTKIIKETLCPTWDQTLVFERIELHGDPEAIAAQPSSIVMELFDYDPVGHDFLGRSVAKPNMIMSKDDRLDCKLKWYPVIRGGEQGGEILAAFELFLNNPSCELPSLPLMKDSIYKVPADIRPVMQLTRIEVLTWGVRHMKKFQLAAVNSPSVEIECGGVIKATPKIKNAKKSPNFESSSLHFDVYLPIEELYMPPLNIRLLDHRSFGVRPLVGTHTIKSMQEYRRDPVANLKAIKDTILEHGFNFNDNDSEYEVESSDSSERDGAYTVQSVHGTKSTYSSFLSTARKSMHSRGSKSGKSLYSWFSQSVQSLASDRQWEVAPFGADEDDLRDDVDWWSKYYASVGDEHLGRVFIEKGYEKMEVFDEELENFFNHFKDLAESYPIYHRKINDAEEDDQDKAVGFFKGTFRIYRLPDDGSEPPPKMLSNVPKNDTIELKVRVYVIKASGLQPQDPNGFSDPYPALKLGKTRIKDRDNYVPRCLDPLFGSFYELECTIPLESELRVQVYDYDMLSGDDLIGETKIDLENRFLSTRRGVCGLPQRYYISGPFAWRDCEKPREILNKWCASQVLPPPIWMGNCRVKVAGQQYHLSHYEIKGKTHKDWGEPEERLALYVLLDLDLVPEHIERRTLYNPLRPGMSQGTLELFIDIFPKNKRIPPPINITPRAPQDLELRVIIWNVCDVIMSDVSLAGQAMSDIYVKGWLKGQDKKQKTDVHYRSLNGEGNFNWRFVFPFKYLPAEEVMVTKKKEHFFSIDKHEEKYPVTFCVQIWDNDIFSPDDFLGVVELHLNRMPKASKFAKTTSLNDLPDNEKGVPVSLVTLFDQKCVKGWWPLYCDMGPSYSRELTGKIEMEVEILSKEDAEAKPAGKGREDPNINPHLNEPDRPATSFNWFTSPWKTLRFIIWANYKWYIIGGLIGFLLLAMILLFLYSAPGALSEKLINLM